MRYAIGKKKSADWGVAMERREFIALLGMATALMPSTAQADSSPATDSFAVQSVPAAFGVRIAGTWAFTSSVNTRRDGSTFDRWGENPKGVFMFDRGGRYSQIIVGSESRVFGSKVFCAFGEYSVDEASKTLITRIEGCSTSRFSGVVQHRTILLLTGDELKYLNPVTANGTTAEVLWKRVA
jgi:hypothetical protein